MPASRGSPGWVAVRCVEAGDLTLDALVRLPPICEILDTRLQKNLLENEESRGGEIMSASEASEDIMQMRPCQLFPEANC